MASEYISVKIDGADFEIKMTAALLMQLQYHLPNPEQIPMISMDPELRQIVVRELLAIRTKTGKVETVRELDQIDISILDVEAVCDWAAEHLLDFFVRRGQALMAQTQARQETFANLKATSAGFTN